MDHITEDVRLQRDVWLAVEQLHEEQGLRRVRRRRALLGRDVLRPHAVGEPRAGLLRDQRQASVARESKRASEGSVGELAVVHGFHSPCPYDVRP